MEIFIACLCVQLVSAARFQGAAGVSGPPPEALVNGSAASRGLFDAPTQGFRPKDDLQPLACPLRHWEALETSPFQADGHALQGRNRMPKHPLLHQHRPHKDIWPPNVRDVLTIVLAAVSLFIAAGGGIGGGGVLVPLYMLVGDFATGSAVALSNVTILGGAISNFGFNITKTHPYAGHGRTLIDWDLILMMEPLTIVGALVGGYVNKVLPSWITTVLLGLLMTLLTWKLVQRAAITWVRETHLQEQQAQKAGGAEAARGPAEPLGETAGDGLAQPLLAGEVRAARENEAEAILLREPTVPIEVVRQLLADPDGVATVHQSLGRSLSYSGRRTSLGVLDRGALRQSNESSPLNTARLGRRSVESTPRDAASRATPRDAGVRDSHGDTTGRSLAALEEGTSGSPEGDKSAGGSPREAGKGRAGASGAAEADEAAQPASSWLEWGGELRVPPVKLGLLLTLFAAVLASDLLKGVRPCGSPGYWLIAWAPVLVVLAVTLAARSALVRASEQRQAEGRELPEGDIAWDRRNTLVYPAVCSLAGLVAGLFGVGGGIVKAPIMLELGVLPEVAAATSATMIMFTAASASVVYLSFGAVPWDYGGAFLVNALVVTLLGQAVVHSLMSRLGRRSLIIWAMATLMLLSALISYYEAVISTISAVLHHRLFRFGHICG